MWRVLIFALSLNACASVERSTPSPAVEREGIKSVIARHLPEFEPCYLKAIDEYPGARGKIVARWLVSDTGAPLSVSIKSADPSLKAAEDCVLSVIGKQTFPSSKPGEELEVIYPFYFSEN